VQILLFQKLYTFK